MPIGFAFSMIARKNIASTPATPSNANFGETRSDGFPRRSQGYIQGNDTYQFMINSDSSDSKKATWSRYADGGNPYFNRHNNDSFNFNSNTMQTSGINTIPLPPGYSGTVNRGVAAKEGSSNYDTPRMIVSFDNRLLIPGTPGPWGPGPSTSVYPGYIRIYRYSWTSPTGWTQEYAIDGPAGTNSRIASGGYHMDPSGTMAHWTTVNNASRWTNAIARSGTSWSSSNTFNGIPADRYRGGGDTNFSGTNPGIGYAHSSNGVSNYRLFYMTDNSFGHYVYFRNGSSTNTSGWHKVSPEMSLHKLIFANSEVPIDSDDVGIVKESYTTNFNNTHGGQYIRELKSGFLRGDVEEHYGTRSSLTYHRVSKDGRVLVVNVSRARRIAYKTTKYSRLLMNNDGVNTPAHVSFISVFRRDSDEDDTWKHVQTINWYDSDTHDLQYSAFDQQWIGRHNGDSDRLGWFNSPVVNNDGSAFAVMAINYQGDSEAGAYTDKFGMTKSGLILKGGNEYKRPGNPHIMVFKYDSDQSKFMMNRVIRCSNLDSESWHMGHDVNTSHPNYSDATSYRVFPFINTPNPSEIVDADEALRTYIVAHHQDQKGDTTLSGVYDYKDTSYVLFDSDADYRGTGISFN